MDMFGHQNVSVELKVVSLSVMFYSLQVGGAVFVVPESILALVAAGNDMIECSLKFNPRLACHSANLYRKPTTSQYSGLTLNTASENEAVAKANVFSSTEVCALDNRGPHKC